MDLRRLYLLLVIVTAILSTGADARQPPRPRPRSYSPLRWTPGGSNLVEFDLTYDFSVPGETRAISLLVVLPRTIPGRQKILSRSYSPKPLRIFSQNGNRYAEFVFAKPERHEEVKIRVKAELYSYNLLAASPESDAPDIRGDRPEDFLRQERYIESDDDRIREIAREIEGGTEIEVVKAIYDYVTDNMKYVINGKDDKGAKKALDLGQGDCTEYSDLFVAICRAKDIPARVVTGYVVQTDTATSKHNWAEVYLKDRGWVPLDPASGDRMSPRFRSMIFGKMNPVYIYLSHVRNDHILDNHNFGKYRYWGDKIKLTDSIEFRFPDQSTADSR